ncbi:tripartite tricarboxylate transporter substrate binding protein [Moorella sulfitireducens]|uniref:tripartite tricarboxylate transporter substrate binding protein n=1 Tax=Neomoorella sulfitireducens TaxID=2972948 RepID=UPI0021AC4843|nr:tripartite tricarboxylate transporter substrate binding protein [Moorella sulfitireducens]
MKKRTLFILVAILLSTITLLGGCSSKQETSKQETAPKYPTKPIELVVHTNPGDGVNLFAMTLAEVLTTEKIVPQPVNVVIKAGGSGANAMAYVNTKEGDPYYLVTCQPSTITTPIRNKLDITYKNFTPIASVIAEDYVVVVRKDSPYQTFRDLIEDAKKNPKKVKQGSGVLGANDTVISKLIEEKAGVEFNLVPFKEGGQMVVALLSGDVDFISANPSEILEQVRAGKMRVLASASEQRLSAFPDVPTMKELGIDVVFKGHRGIMAPKGISQEVVKYWEEAILKATKTEKWKKYLNDNIVSDFYLTSEELSKYWDELNNMYKEIYTRMGVISN